MHLVLTPKGGMTELRYNFWVDLIINMDLKKQQQKYNNSILIEQHLATHRAKSSHFSEL